MFVPYRDIFERPTSKTYTRRDLERKCAEASAVLNKHVEIVQEPISKRYAVTYDLPAHLRDNPGEWLRERDCNTVRYWIEHLDAEITRARAPYERPTSTKEPAVPLHIDEIKIVQAYDDDPDLSYLEQDYNDPSIPPEEAAKYQQQDAERLETYGALWYMTGIYAQASIIRIYPTGGHQYVADARSGGLWGVESDSDPEYFQSIAQEQLAELRDILTDMGIDPAEIDAKIKEVDPIA